MFRFSFFFSIQSLLILCIALFIFYILQDYPQWKSNRQPATTREESKPTSSKQQQESAENKKDSIENVSIAHYILVMPFAVLYIIVRVLFDAIRYSLYYTLWTIEQSLPYIDDWLFDTLTVWLPAKVNEWSEWWKDKGKPAYLIYQDHFYQHTLPALIQLMENAFVNLYRLGCVCQSLASELIDIWTKFVNGHDWNQLVDDLSEVAYRAICQPMMTVTTSIIRLCQLIYRGTKYLYLSMKADIVWAATEAVPRMYDYVISTRLVHLLSAVFDLLYKQLLRIILGIRDHLLAPTLGRALSWLVRGIDYVLLLLQTNKFQQRLERVCRFLIPQTTWVITEIWRTVSDLWTVIRMIHYQLIYPAYLVYVKHVMPRLSVGYHQMRDRLIQLYKRQIHPAWLYLIPYIRTPIIQIYIFIRPLGNLTQAISTELIKWSLRLGSCMQVGIIQFFQLFAVYMHQLYEVLQQWLMKQAPLLSKLLQHCLDKIYAYNWQGMKDDLMNNGFILYQWISEECNLIYASIERSLVVWVNEQASMTNEKKME